MREARGLVSASLTEWALDHLVDDATLLVSELVTNAIVHAGTEVELAVALLDDCVEVAVTDRHPARSLPGRRPTPQATSAHSRHRPASPGRAGPRGWPTTIPGSG